jgi:hypothetical protein
MFSEFGIYRGAGIFGHLHQDAVDAFKTLTSSQVRTGEDIYKELSAKLGSDKKASEALYDAGIRGIRYEDAFSRGRGDPDAAHNYVMFHHDDVNIEAKYRQEGETPTPRTTPVDNGIPKDTPGTKNEATDLLEKSYNFHKPEASGERITFEALDRKALPKAIADALDAVEKFTGANVHIVRETTKGREGQMRFSGAQIGKHIFINENNEHPLVHVLSHEWTHYLKKTMPPLYQILENEIKRQATGPHGKLIDAYTASAVRRGYAPEKALEELTADTTGDAMGDRDFIERMARENPAAYGKLAESFGKYLDTFTTKHADLGSNKYVVEVGAYRQVLRAVMHTHAGVRDIQAKRDALTASMRAPVAATVDERKGTDEGPLRPGRTKDAVGLMYGDEPIPNNKMKKADAAKFLEERTREANGGKILDLTNDEDRMTMARTIADEAQAHIEAQGNALEWYDSTIDHTMAMLVVKHPEIAYDEDARTAFTIALAVTSQNMNVFDNLSFADVVYSHFKQHKEFPIIGTGEKLEAMKQNFRKVNRLRERLTWSEIREFFEREFTAGDLAKLKFKVAGELVDTKVYGSAILGPKIGNGFWSNLNGNFKPTTMDMWFMRTMGRLRGAILNGTVGPERLAKTITTFKEALSSPDDRLNLEKIGINKADLKDDDDVIAAAFALSAAHARDFSANRERYKTKSTPDGDILKSPEVRAADRIVSNIKGVNDAPANGTERNNLRDVVSKALAELKRRGVDLKPASLQALIWYPEQALYAKLGVKLKVHGEDYASATFKHLKDQGFDPAELERAAGFAPGTSRFGRSAALREAAIEADRRAGETVSEGAEEEPETDDVEEPDEHLPAEENVAPHSDETGDSEPVKTIRSPVGKLQIETPAGGTRTGTGEDGKPFSRTMKHDYGYIDGLAGRDGGSMDVLVGEGAGNPMRPVFVVHQKKADGSFDEHKVLVGFANRADAVRAYMSEYPKGWHGLGQVEQFSTAEFKRWAATEGREQAQVGKVDPAVPRFQVRPQQHDAVAMHATTSNPMPVRTGHEGTPLARLDLPNAPRASQARTHFDDASTVTKAHQVVLRNLYDVNTDPRNLFDKAVASAQAKGLPLDEPHVMNELENHIVAGGFDGYRSADGKAIVLGGKVKMEKANEGKPVAPSRPVEQPAPNVERAEAPAETPRPDVTRTAPGPREDLAGAGEGKGDEGTAQGTVEGEGQRVPDRASGKDEDQVVTDDDTSIRNAATDMVRKLRGAAPIERIGGRTANEVEADAHAALFKNPQIGSQIAASVAAKPRNISDTEAAILAIDRQRIANAHDEATKRIVKAMETGDEEEETLARGAQKLAEDARELNEKAAVRAGTEWSNSGRARMLAVKQDETLSSLLNKYKVAAGRDVNTEERAKIGKQADEIKKLKKQIESPGLKDKPEMVQAAAQKKFADALAELKKLPKDEQMTKECYI